MKKLFLLGLCIMVFSPYLAGCNHNQTAEAASTVKEKNVQKTSSVQNKNEIVQPLTNEDLTMKFGLMEILVEDYANGNINYESFLTT